MNLQCGAKPSPVRPSQNIRLTDSTMSLDRSGVKSVNLNAPVRFSSDGPASGIGPNIASVRDSTTNSRSHDFDHSSTGHVDGYGAVLPPLRLVVKPFFSPLYL